LYILNCIGERGVAAMKDDKKSRRLLIRLVFVCIAVTLASAVGIFFLPTIKSVLLTVAAVSSAAAAAAAALLFSGMEKRIDCVESIIEKSTGYAEIRYDKKTETARVSGKLTEITGIELPGEVLDDTDYKKLVVDMISCPSDAGSDIYMAARPECWIRVRTFENENFEYTMINDVSELASCKNIIKSMKYYDSETGLLCRDAFIAKVRSAAGSRAGTVGMITLLINGLDRLTSFKSTAAADKIISKAAAFIRKFENPHNIFAGRTATSEFCVLVTDTYEDGCRKYAEKLYDGFKEIFSMGEGSEYIQTYCGYAVFTEENDAGTMMSAADYAAFEARSTAASAPVAFDRANYVLKAYDFKKIQVFKRIIGEKMVSYHFQPVVDARTGAVYGFEALMRPRETDGIRLSPIELLDIAEKQGMSAAVEELTLSRTIAFLWENRDFFSDKKLFVNSIPNCFISAESYESIFNHYGGVFGSLIIEITEGVQITEKSLALMRERYRSKGTLIAMDDYGSGYANESALISMKPDIIKIDRALIQDINGDARKQHLVSNMIDFARSHGIKTLAEGVETRGELETLITFGIDYIQGYYTGRPAPEISDAVPEEIRDEILSINLKTVGYSKKTYSLDSDLSCDIAELAAKGFTDLTAASESISLTGNPARAVNLRISCPDGYKGTLTVRDVNIFGLEAPVLTLGKNCDVTLIAEGKNTFSYEGIRVPAGSKFKLCGGGQLNIDMNNSGVIIGGSCQQDFGSILINMNGSLNITSRSDDLTAIGGGMGGSDSSVEITGGTVNAALKGISVVGIGSASGQVRIKLNNCKLTVDAAGQNVVAVGSKGGRTDIDCCCTAAVACSGDNCCNFGTLENGSGSLMFGGGSYDLAVHAKNSVNIGSFGGHINTEISAGVYNICCEGNTAVGVGDAFGAGKVTVSGGIFRMHIAASKEVSIGCAKGRTVIKGGNIATDSQEKISAVSPFGAPLEAIETDCGESGKFSRQISFGGKEYAYLAEAARGESFVTVYLPQGYEL